MNTKQIVSKKHLVDTKHAWGRKHALMRFIFALILCACAAFAKQFTLYAPNITTKDGKMLANDGVVLFSKDYFARAKSLEYDESSGVLILRENVFINNHNSYTNTDTAVIDTRQNHIEFKDFFLGNSDFEIWLKSKNASYDGQKVILYDSYVSSCEVDNPTWQIAFKRGEFDVKTKDLTLKHSLFYYQGVPVFYMPVFDINVENTRRSGLLVPDVGVASKDGFYYRQPIYFAPVEWFDYQIDPIVRSHRGWGMYNNMRFAGPNNLRFELGSGVFNDKKSYTKGNSLSNSQHRGVEFFYTQDRIFAPDEYYEGVWAKGAYINDVDYINLVSPNLDLEGNFLSSRFNYFVANDQHFGGVFVRYYIDTSKQSNDQTIQELPHLNYHRYSDGLFDNFIQYSIDADIKNFYRKELSTATLYKLDVPISLNLSLLDNYIDLKFEEKFTSSYASYNRYARSDEYILASSQMIRMSSSLSERYDGFYHTISPEISFNFPGYLRGGYSEDYLYNYNQIKSIDLAFGHSFYNLDALKKINQTLRVSYDQKRHSFGIANHKIWYSPVKDAYIADELAYDLENDKVQKHFVTMGYSTKTLDTKIGYFYSNTPQLETPKNENIVHSLSYIFKNRYKVFYSLEYDLRQSHFNQYTFGLSYRKKCINYTLSFKQSIDPVLSHDKRSQKQRGVYFAINLYPLGGVTYDYAIE